MILPLRRTGSKTGTHDDDAVLLIDGAVKNEGVPVEEDIDSKVTDGFGSDLIPTLSCSNSPVVKLNFLRFLRWRHLLLLPTRCTDGGFANWGCPVAC